jgi:hypothetical protein
MKLLTNFLDFTDATALFAQTRTTRNLEKVFQGNTFSKFLVVRLIENWCKYLNSNARLGLKMLG